MTSGREPPGASNSSSLPDRVGGYQVLSRLSKGGMGEVFLGRRDGSHGFEKKVAIKLIHSHLEGAERYRQSFFREARLAARLSHPNVCQVFDFGVDRGICYIVMEYLEGLSVARLLRLRASGAERLPQQLAARIVADAAAGLHHAHNLKDDDGHLLGVVHRDVSPQNLLVTHEGCTKVLDFGVAKTAERSLFTQANLQPGKPSYMAPEQAQGEEVDARADIFSLGVILFELLTGQRLFLRDTPYDTLRAVVDAPIPAPRGLVPDLDPALAEVVRVALAREREDRFQTALAMGHAIESSLARQGLPVTAASLAEHLARMSRGRLVTVDDRGAAEQAHAPVVTAPLTPEARPARPDESTATSSETIGERPTATTRELEPPTSPKASTPPPPRTARPLVGVLVALVAVTGAGLLLWKLSTPTQAPAPSAISTAAGEAGPSALPTATATADRADRVYDASATADAARPRGAQAGTPDADGGRAELRSPVDSAEPRLGVDAPSRGQPRKRPVSRRTPVLRAPTPGGHGALTFTAKPYGLVRVDGAVVGPTPLVEHRLPAGRHRVELIAPNTGEVRLQREIEVVANEVVRLKAR